MFLAFHSSRLCFKMVLCKFLMAIDEADLASLQTHILN
jgi:hypothetical protein